MKKLQRLALAVTFMLVACQPAPSAVITLMDGAQTKTIHSVERIPQILLTQNGITLQVDDHLLLNGIKVPMEQPLPAAGVIQLQVRRAVTITLSTPQGARTIRSAAFTVGEALNEAGILLYSSDLIDPPAATPITQDITVTYTPARDLTISLGDKTLLVRSAAGTVGEVFAATGLSLVGADTSSPLPGEAPPPDGQMSLVRVYETASVDLKPIPFTTQKIESADLPLGQEKTVQPGINGLAMIRTRVRYENGREVSRVTESETVMRAPQERIVAGGSQIVLAPIGGNSPYEYWVKVQMYATVYSPCNSGTGGCSYGTASGARAGQGIVAVDYSIYSLLAGMRLYIPGYGLATIGDTGGGPIIESAFGVPRTSWIDLGFNEGEMRDMTGWVTVYFLAPAPVEIPYFLR